MFRIGSINTSGICNLQSEYHPAATAFSWTRPCVLYRFETLAVLGVVRSRLELGLRRIIRFASKVHGDGQMSGPKNTEPER